MSAEYSELVAFRDSLRRMAEGSQDFIARLAVGEGVVAVRNAVNICEKEHIDNTSLYKRSFHSSEHATHSGNKFRVEFSNNTDYAKHLEYGFRSHFVPGHWEGKTFVYARNDPHGGMYVGPYKGYVRGRFVFRRAVYRTKNTQDARLKRKMLQYINWNLRRGGVK